MSLQIHTDVFSFSSYEEELARIKAEMEAKIRAEIRQEMESKIRKEIREEIREEIFEEILTFLRQQAPSVQANQDATSSLKANQQSPKEVRQEIIWNIPDDGMAHYWSFQGTKYVVDADRCVWNITEEGQPGNWVGIVDLKRGIIDTSVPEPEYID